MPLNDLHSRRCCCERISYAYNQFKYMQKMTPNMHMHEHTVKEHIYVVMKGVHPSRTFLSYFLRCYQCKRDCRPYVATTLGYVCKYALVAANDYLHSRTVVFVVVDRR